MLTIFAIPKPFIGHNGIIQRNAILSWIQLEPQCEIILFGDDSGVAEIADEFGLKHIIFIEKNEFGTPLLNSAFNFAQKIAQNNILMYVNADILFTQDLIDSIRRIDKSDYLLCGQRWDLDVDEKIDFTENDWADKLLVRVKNEGELHSISGIDYFIFKKNMVTMPAFAVGRPGWDSWLLFDIRYRGIPIINATNSIMTIHQNHDFSHSKFGEKKRVAGPEWQTNIKLAGGLTNMLTLRDADWVLDKNGLRRPDLKNRIFSLMSLRYSWRFLLAIKRKIQNLL